MKNKLFLFILVFIFISLASAQPPFTPIATGTPGLILLIPEPPMAHPVNTSYDLHVHVLNNTDGKMINSSLACFYHLEMPNGTKIAEANLTQNPASYLNISWNASIPSSNLSRYGLYNVLVQCVGPASITGASRLILDINYKGVVLSSGQLFFYSMTIFFITGLCIVLYFFARSLPEEDSRDDLGNIVAINYLKHLKALFYGVIWILIIVALFIISNVGFAYLPDLMIANIFFSFYKICFAVSIALLPVYAIWTVIKIFRDSKIQQSLKEGFNE